LVEHHHVELRSTIHAGDDSLEGLVTRVLLKLDAFGQGCTHTGCAQVHVENLAYFHAGKVRRSHGAPGAVEVLKHRVGINRDVEGLPALLIHQGKLVVSDTGYLSVDLINLPHFFATLRFTSLDDVC